MIGSYYRSRI